MSTQPANRVLVPSADVARLVALFRAMRASGTKDDEVVVVDALAAIERKNRSWFARWFG
jgi:hypothetical protein